MSHLTAKRLKYYREKARMSPAELAALIGVEPTDIIDYETGRVVPDMRIYFKLSHVLDISTDELLVFEKNAEI
ncbi:MAG: helix-turn-helix transcriptional regulator [Clostridia bacterium]|nr:helix-turn-helix transcriptional regulator [Clostridia bacterium]